MKKMMIMVLMATVLLSCGENATGNSNSQDSLGDNPSVIEDETQHPTGVTNQNVISTDTAAMNVERMHDTTAH